MKKGRGRDRVATDGGSGLSQNNPFDGLSGLDLPDSKTSPAPREKPVFSRKRSRETLLLRRLKAGKGGKVVTEISGFDADPQTISRLLKQLQSSLGTGGTCKGKVVELQGECRDRVRPLLEDLGYRVKG